jgi:hypothetical protein
MAARHRHDPGLRRRSAFITGAALAIDGGATA